MIGVTQTPNDPPRPQWFDAVSVHPYRGGPPESVLVDYANLTALIGAHAPSDRGAVPILSGEWGYSTCVSPCWEAAALRGAAVAGALGGVSEATQADYLVRRFLLDAIAGVAGSVWYDWHDDGSDPTSNEANFGTTRAPYGNASSPYAPKPSYTAAAALAAWRAGYAFAGRVNQTGLPAPVSAYQYIAAFAPGGGRGAPMPRYAVWATFGGSQCVVDAASMQDCGYYGIDEKSCEARGCCYQQPYVAGPQCFYHNGDVAVNMTFALPAAEHASCFNVADEYGGSLAPVCANPDGTLTVPATPSPVFVSGYGASAT